MNKTHAPRRRIEKLLQQARAFEGEGHLESARRIYEDITALDPENFKAHYSLGVVLCRAGKFREAVSEYGAALAINPRSAEVNCGLGHALNILGEHRESLEALDKAIGFNPKYADAHYNKGVALRSLHRNEEAISSFEAALAINPRDAEAWNNKGNACHDMGRYEEALVCYDKALAIEPDYVRAHKNRGATLERLNRTGEALACYDDALAIFPEDVDALDGRGNALLWLKKPESAAACFEKLLKIDPARPYAAGRRLSALMQCCDWSKYPSYRAALIQEVDHGKRCATPFAYLSIFDSPQSQKICAETFAADQFPVAPSRLWAGERYDHQRIRVAYISADYHEHAVSFLTAGLIERHDRSRFETIAISTGFAPASSEMRQRLQRAFERFFDVTRMKDHEVARLLRDLEVDIVVDLAGYTQDCRPGILAFHPVPIQINYLGYMGTMGADYIDYIIADEFVIPRNRQIHYSEKLVYLPDSFLVIGTTRKIAGRTPTRAQAGLPGQEFVFCCFNNSYKINPPLFDIWMRLMQRVEGSVLWLAKAQAETAANLRREAQARGIDPARLVFAPKVERMEDHLARYRLADLFLDTLPYNAHTTAGDALLAGLPLLTHAGEAFAGRVAGSLLHAVGLPELITHSLEEYQDLAVSLARDKAKLREIRKKLAQNRDTYPLFNTARFTRHLESAYEEMWRRHQRGEAPGTFSVAPID